MENIRLFESFAGIGSIRISLDNLGIDYTPVGIMEVDKYAVLSYDAIHNPDSVDTYETKENILKEIQNKNLFYNFSTYKSEIPKDDKELLKLYNAHLRSNNYGDIRLIDPKDLPDFDLFVYSPPCKNISIQGGQAGFDKDSKTQSSLIWHCEQIIREKRPKYMLFENVKNILSQSHIKNFYDWVLILESLGYNNYYKILNSSDFGLSQNRERCIMFSILKEYDDYKNLELPDTNYTTSCLYDILDKDYDEKLVINKVSTRKDLDNCLKNATRHLDLVDTKREFTSPLRAGSLNNNSKYEITNRVYLANGTSPTILANYNSVPKILYKEDNNYIIRTLSSLECWKSQGLTKEQYLRAKNAGVDDKHLYERAGRTISIKMLETVFSTYLKGES